MQGGAAVLAAWEGTGLAFPGLPWSPSTLRQLCEWKEPASSAQRRRSSCSHLPWPLKQGGDCARGTSWTLRNGKISSQYYLS